MHQDSIDIGLQNIRLNTPYDVEDATTLAMIIADPERHGPANDASAHWYHRTAEILTVALLHAAYETPQRDLRSLGIRMTYETWKPIMRKMAQSTHPVIKKTAGDIMNLPPAVASAYMTATCSQLQRFIYITDHRTQPECLEAIPTWPYRFAS